jgi:hypothetical protein
MEDAETSQRVILEHLSMITEPAYRRRRPAKLKWHRARKVLPAEEGGGKMVALIATTEEAGIDSMAIEQQLRELLALGPKQ